MLQGKLTPRLGRFRRLRSPKWRLLVSTFEALLDVRIVVGDSAATVRVVDSGRGIYYGLSRSRDGYVVAARNTDAGSKTTTPGIAVCALVEFDKSLKSEIGGFASDELWDMHEIRTHGADVLVIRDDGRLLSVDMRRGAVRPLGDFSVLVPDDLRHEPPPNRLHDSYHFNSLFVEDEWVTALAHDWSWGSFALKAPLHSPWSLEKCTTGMGQWAHNVAPVRDGLWFCDSSGQTLCRLAPVSGDQGNTRRIAFPGQFLRGLALGNRVAFVGGGTVEHERKSRQVGDSYLHVVDRAEMALVSSISLGSFGNVADVLLISENDETDSCA
jgi:hypothetical protein